MKKRILSLLLCLVLCLSLLPMSAFATEPTKYNDGGGDGTQSEPWRISTLAQLNDLADAVNGEGTYSSASDMKDKYFKLTANIGSASAPFEKIIGKDRNEGQPHFSGNFDGDGHTVLLNIINEDSSATNMYCGMFVLREAKISNLTVMGTVNAKNTNASTDLVYAGGIAGSAIYSRFDNCRSACTVTAQKAGSTGYAYAGGICGSSSSGTVINCSSGGLVTAKGGSDTYAGGIAGISANSTKIKNSFSDAAVTASDASTGNNAGGIVGYNNGEETILANCYYSGTSVSGSNEKTGGVCGSVGSATIDRSYYDSTVLTGKTAVGGKTDTTDVKGLPTTDMQAASGTSGALVDLLNGYEELNNSSIVRELKNWAVTSGSYPLFEGMTPPVTDYGITVNTVQVTSANASNVLDNGEVSYDPINNKLSVSAFTQALTIAGNNTVDIEINGTTGPAVSGALTVTGADDVTVTSECTGGPVIGNGADISCTGDVTITASNGFAISGDLKVVGAKNVTVENESSSAGAPAISSAADISCTGNVTIKSAGSGSPAISEELKVSNATNVTVTSATTNAPVIGNGADIRCTGNVTIEAPDGGPAISGNLKVEGAKNVTLKNESSSTTAPVIYGTADITSSGDVLIQTSGSGAAVSNSITYTRIAGAGGYLVKTGDTEASLNTVATKTESEVYGPETCSNKIIKIVSNYSPVDYNVWVNNERFASNKLTINCGGGTAVLDPTTTPWTLTLNNAKIGMSGTTTGVVNGDASGIKSELDDLTIYLKGTNEIGAYSGSDMAAEDNNGLETTIQEFTVDAGVYCSSGKNVSFASYEDGSLTIIDYGAGIQANNITFGNDFKGALTVVDFGGSEPQPPCAIFAQSVTINGGTFDLTSIHSDGISAKNITVNDCEEFKAKGKVGDTNAYAVIADSSLEIADTLEVINSTYTKNETKSLDPTDDNENDGYVIIRPKAAPAVSFNITNGTPENAKETNHGYITIDNGTAAEGETVTITVNPAEGYQLKSNSLKMNYNSDQSITPVATLPAGQYEFTMPAYDVTVTAEFIPTKIPATELKPAEINYETLAKAGMVAAGVVTGVVVTKIVVDKLHEIKATKIAAETAAESTPEIKAEEMPMVRKGDRGDAVVTLQTKLNDLGYNCGEVDGIFGQNTLNAVKAFQTAKGLTADGVVGKLTWGELL